MFDRILVPLDGSSVAECVLSHVVALARAFGARVVVLQVLERAPDAGGARSIESLDWHIRKAEAGVYLGDVAARLRKGGVRADDAVLEGHVPERILSYAHSENIDLIVLSSHGLSGLSGWNVSSVVQKIILRARVPTMIVRAYQVVSGELADLRYRRLMVPLDGSQRAECVLPLATALAQTHDSQVILAHVVVKPEMPRRAPLAPEDAELMSRITERNREEAATYLEQVQARFTVDIETRLTISDNAASTLHELVDEQDVDLVLMSAHGYSGETRWPYGSIAISFIVYGVTPLLIVQDVSLGDIALTRAEVAAREYKGH